MNTRSLAVLVFFLIHINIVFSQTCCSAGAPLTSSFDIGNVNQKGFILGFDYEFNSVNRLVEDTRKIKNDPRTRNAQSYLVRVGYSYNRHWAFSIFLPWIIQNRTTFSTQDNTQGIGDITVIGQYTIFSKKEAQIKFSTGLKLPTGLQFIQDERGINLSPDMQTGSGTFDFTGRIAWLRHHLFIRNLSNQSSFSYRHNNTNEHFGDPDKVNGRSFKFGNESIFSTTFSYLLVAKKWFILPDISLQIRHVSPNKEEKRTAPNSGGFWFKIPIGVQILPNEKISIRAYVEFPVKESLNGLQITTDYKLGVQMRYGL